jgi:hypothetical protein
MAEYVVISVKFDDKPVNGRIGKVNKNTRIEAKDKYDAKAKFESTRDSLKEMFVEAKRVNK